MKTKTIKAGWVDHASLPCTIRVDGTIIKASKLERDLDHTTFIGHGLMPKEVRGKRAEVRVENSVYVLIW